MKYQHSKLLKRYKRPLIIGFAAVGFIILIFAKAASYSIDVEPESGTITNAQKKNDPTASGNEYVQFGPNASLVSNRSMWVWDYSQLSSVQGRQTLADFASAHNITNIYLESESLVTNNTAMLSSIISDLHSKNISVELLFGNPDWTLPANHQQAVNLAQKAVTFYNANPTSRPAGIHYDVEPSSLPQWSSNTQQTANDILDLYQKLAGVKGPLKLTADLQMIYNVTNVARNGTTKSLVDWSLDYLDSAVIMSYRDTALTPATDNIVYHSLPAVQYASTINKRVYSGVETTCGITPIKVTFCEEGLATMNSELQKVIDNLKSYSGFGGVAIHDYAGYSSLKS